MSWRVSRWLVTRSPGCRDPVRMAACSLRRAMVLIWCHGRDPRPHERVNTCVGRTAGTSPPRPSFLKTSRLVPRLTSLSPTSGYPTFDLYLYVSLDCAVQNCLQPSNHRLLQPSLCVCCLLCVALDANLVVVDEYQHSPLVLIPTLSQQSERKLQTVGSGALDWSIEAVGQPLDVHAASSLWAYGALGERRGESLAALPSAGHSTRREGKIGA